MEKSVIICMNRQKLYTKQWLDSKHKQEKVKTRNSVGLLPKALHKVGKCKVDSLERPVRPTGSRSVLGREPTASGADKSSWEWWPTLLLMVAYMKISPPGTGMRGSSQGWPLPTIYSQVHWMRLKKPKQYYLWLMP